MLTGNFFKGQQMNYNMFGTSKLDRPEQIMIQLLITP